jgi:hypothetical protein
MLRIAAVAAAVAGALGVAGCNLVLDASDYAVGPNDASMTATGNEDGSGSATDATSDTTSQATSDGGTPETSTSAPVDGGQDAGDAHAAPEASADGGAIGDFCLGGSDCANGECDTSDDWCTASCTSSASCGTNSLGYANGCVTSGASGACAPGCGTSDDCSFFGSSYTCSPVTSGSALTVCTNSTSSGGAGLPGDSCSFDSDCASNDCYDEEWCTATCTGPSDTSCGLSGSGSTNYCAPAPSGSGYQCAPTCITSADCASNYVDSGAVCKSVGSQSVCVVPTGALGDQCVGATTCTAGTCNENFGWCSETCTTNTQCGSSSSGKPNYCLQMGGSGPSYCVPGCTQYGDCAPYEDPNDTFCMPVGGSTTEQACGTTGGQVGDPCLYDTDCAGSATCGDQYTCTQDCTGKNDTSCGSNSQGVVNKCAYSDSALGGAGYECFAGCTTSAQCVPYPYGDLTCQTISGWNVCANADATTESVTIQVKQRQSHPPPRRH